MSFQQCLRRFCSRTVNGSGVKCVGIIGAGQMGVGIAITCAFIANRNVILVDSDQNSLDKGMKFVNEWLNKQVSKGEIIPNIEQFANERIIITHDLTDVEKYSCDFVIEAVPEMESLKRNIFESLNTICTSMNVIFTSNTSSIPISKIASFMDIERRPFVSGMHFMNPVPIMKLIEVIPSLMTSAQTISTIKAFGTEMNKECSVSSDSAGFIANRILMPYINEAVICLQEGIATREDIDLTMRIGTNVPMGPLTLADFIGIDTCWFIMNTLHSELGDKYLPAPLLKRMIDAGLLGKKSGQGFYQYKK